MTPAWRDEGSIPTLKLYAMGTNKQIAKMKLDDGHKTGDKLKNVGGAIKDWMGQNWVTCVAAAALAVTGAGLIVSGSFVAAASYTALSIHAINGVVIGGCVASVGLVEEVIAYKLATEAWLWEKPHESRR